MPLRYLILLAGCGTPLPLPAHLASGGTVLVDRSDAVDAALDGGGLLSIRVHDGATTQVLVTDTTTIMRTTRDTLAIDGTEVTRIGPAWIGPPLPPTARAALARILALDVDLAVQGSALVFGDTYAACTLRCEAAAACAGRVARCGDDIVICGACLERAP